MIYENYKKLSVEEKELHDFEMTQKILTTIREVCAQAMRTNGRISELEKWRNISLGGLAVVMAIVVPLFVDLITSR